METINVIELVLAGVNFGMVITMIMIKNYPVAAINMAVGMLCLIMGLR